MLDTFLLDWLNLAIRWFHLVVGIAWIGTSLYFMWLDASLEKPRRPSPGPGETQGGVAPFEQVEGELWMVHSGGFYRVEKRLVAPGDLVGTLHWFKWEAAFTLLSGLALLTVVYYATGGVYLVDPNVSAITPGMATALGLALLVAGWVVYDLLWRSSLAEGRGTVATVISFSLLFALCWGLTRVLSGRAAFLHVGAMIGTLMVVNVWVHIVPAQREMIAATREGRTPDYSLGKHAKRRSTHNSYVTFPVIFMMLSNHYPGLYGHPLNWLILILMIVVGAGVRHFMITQEHRHPAHWVWAPVVAAVLALVVLTWPTARGGTAAPAGAGGAVPFSVARGIVDLRCRSCHSAQPTDDGFRAAPNGVVFDTPESLRTRAALIKERTIVLRNMPLANKTRMTDEERELLGRWIDQGARPE